MLDVDQALEYIFNDVAPDRTFRTEALEIYQELQHRKAAKNKKRKIDFDDYKVGVIRKALNRKRNKGECTRLMR